METQRLKGVAKAAGIGLGHPSSNRQHIKNHQATLEIRVEEPLILPPENVVVANEHPVNEQPEGHSGNVQQEKLAGEELDQDLAMEALAKKFPIFVGKISEDVDFHVNRFEYYWKVARPQDQN